MRKLYRLASVFVLLALLLTLRSPSRVSAASTSATYPGTCANDASAGTVAWSSPGNAVSDNASYAQGTASTGNPSQYLKCTNFGFSIPTGATIDGIIVEVERYSTFASFEAKDLSARIVKSDGTFGSTDKADLATVYPTTPTVKSYGSSTDVWGESWAYTDINDADFGFILQVTNHDSTGQGNVDYVRITIYYTTAAPSTPDPVLENTGEDFFMLLPRYYVLLSAFGTKEIKSAIPTSRFTSCIIPPNG